MASILVIDDDLALRVPLAKVLLRAGHQVVTTSNGKEATAIMRQAPADVVITDILMPEKDGLETIMGLHREFPGVRIIAIPQNISARQDGSHPRERCSWQPGNPLTYCTRGLHRTRRETAYGGSVPAF